MYEQRCKSEYASLSPHPERWPQLVDALRPMWRREPSFTKAALGRIHTPTVVSDGQYDEIIKRDHTKRIADEIPRARLLWQADVSHFAMLQNAPQFNQALIEFLSV